MLNDKADIPKIHRNTHSSIMCITVNITQFTHTEEN